MLRSKWNFATNVEIFQSFPSSSIHRIFCNNSFRVTIKFIFKIESTTYLLLKVYCIENRLSIRIFIQAFHNSYKLSYAVEFDINEKTLSNIMSKFIREQNIFSITTVIKLDVRKKLDSTCKGKDGVTNMYKVNYYQQVNVEHFTILLIISTHRQEMRIQMFSIDIYSSTA